MRKSLRNYLANDYFTTVAHTNTYVYAQMIFNELDFVWHKDILMEHPIRKPMRHAC